MKKVSSQNIRKAAKWALPAGILALGFATVVMGQPAGKSPKAAVTSANSTNAQSQPSESPAPTTAPQVSVNGAQIPTDKNGSTIVTIPGGKAQVDVANGHTQITTNDDGTRGDTSNTTSGNMDVNLDSHSNGGTNWGSTQVYGYSYSSTDTGTSTSSTSIFSTDADHVSVSQP